MADKIRGITVEIGGDTSGLSKALKNSNKQIKSTQSQLKDVDKLLKLDPTNIDLLRQREKLLNDAVKETGDKLKSLKEIQGNMDSSGVDKNSEQYMALQREIISTEQELGNLETAAANSNARLTQIGTIADNISGKMDHLSSKTAALSGAAAAGLGALAAAAYDVVLASDDLNTMSKQSGFSTAELQEFEYAADRMDVDVDTIVGAGRKLKKSMTSTSSDTKKAFKKLGVSVKDSQGNLRDSTEVFWECVEALGNIEDETTRDAYAMQIFGKSADELAGLVDDGGEAFREYAAEAEELGLVLDQDTLDSLNAVNDEIDKLKAMFTATFAKTGAKLVEKLTPVFEKLAAKIEKVVEWVANLSDDQLWTFVEILAGIAVISPALKMFSKLAKAVKTVTTVLKVLQPVITGVNAVLVANPIILIIAAIAALIVICVKFKDQICGVIDKITNWIHSKLEKDWTEVFGTTLGGVLNAFCKTFLKIWDTVSGAVKTAVSLIHDIFTGDWEGVWNTAKNAVSNGIDSAKTTLDDFDSWMQKTFTKDWTDTFGDRLGGWMNSASENILEAWSGEDGIKSHLDDAVAWLDDTFSGDWDHAWSNIKSLGTGVWDGIKDGWETTCKPALNTALTWVDRTFGDGWRTAWSGIKANANNAWTKIQDGWSKEGGLKDELCDAAGWVLDTFASGDWSTAWAGIKSVGEGAIDGIKDAWDKKGGLKDKLVDMIKYVNDDFKLKWSNAWSGVKRVFTNIFSTIATACKAPLNGIVGIINKLIGKINDFIDEVNDFIDSVNGLEILGWSPNIGKIGKISTIPTLAKGGTVLSGSAIVGEAGAELLTVAGGRTTVTPLTNGEHPTAGNVTIYTQQMTEAQVDYLIARVNRGLGVMA